MSVNNRERRKFLFFTLLIYILAALFSLGAFGEEVRVVRLSESNVGKILISTRGTVLSFPAKPTKVILGRNGSFGIEYVENDLAISPLILSARSNLFVYVLGRRFAFDLSTTSQAGSSVIQVRDAIEKKQKADKK